MAVAFVAVGLLAAFTYPLVQEGYDRVGSDTFTRAQQQLLEQSIASYLKFNKNPGWTVETPTRQILNDLATGWDRSMSGKRDSFLPQMTSVDSLNKGYRRIYKSPSSFKVLAKS